jgi:hypothetical protein
LIGCGHPNGIVPFALATGFASDKIFVDPTLEAYKLLGLAVAENLSEIGGKQKS